MDLIERLFKGSCTDLKETLLRRNYSSKMTQLFLLHNLYSVSNKKLLDMHLNNLY